ncbi:MAG TPA: leucyl/phenylalanyl-tRNA--protein transferase [Bacteroidetes bacterium]|nr:leucyl/phenylalanyl-tRNA--protein transferase [Bacteroidota bacterium]
MPVFKLNAEIVGFPPAEFAESSGLLAIGGKLDPNWLIEAYQNGIFPWFNEEDPILWWSPDPRSVAKPGEIKISKSMKPYFSKNIFTLKIDTSFENVINHCQNIKRHDQDGTWITDELKLAYIEVHKMGFAHSFETWKNGKLVGGLYGVSLGKMFFGESMFSLESNASKFAFISLSEILKKNKFTLIDCQIPNPHLTSMGCYEMKRTEFLDLLKQNNHKETLIGNWNDILLYKNFI